MGIAADYMVRLNKNWNVKNLTYLKLPICMQINRSISQSIIWLEFAYSQLAVSQQLLHHNFF